jgi:hypothetical protein
VNNKISNRKSFYDKETSEDYVKINNIINNNVVAKTSPNTVVMNKSKNKNNKKQIKITNFFKPKNKEIAPENKKFNNNSSNKNIQNT